MSQERSLYLPRLTNVSGDYIGLGHAPDGSAVLLYAQTRLRPLRSGELMGKPRLSYRMIGEGCTTHPNIKAVNGRIAAGNGDHLGVLVHSLEGDLSNPFHALGDWLCEGAELAKPKPLSEMQSELHINERSYTARIGAVVTQKGAAMLTIWEKNKRPEAEFVAGPEEPGVLRITSSYRNNTFSPGDYFPHAFKEDNPKDLAKRLVQDFPPVTALYKQVSVLFYDFKSLSGEIADALAAPSQREAIVVSNPVEFVENTNRMLNGRALISERYHEPLPSANGLVLERKKS